LSIFYVQILVSLHRVFVRQKLDVLRSFSGSDALLLLEGKFEGNKASGRTGRAWIDVLLHWTLKNKCHKVKRLAENREINRKETYQWTVAPKERYLCHVRDNIRSVDFPLVNGW